MNAKTHPFQVRTWLPREPALKFLGQAHWTEECRCLTQDRAERIAKALRVAGYGPIIAVVKFNDDGSQKYVACYPDRGAVKEATGVTIP